LIRRSRAFLGVLGLAVGITLLPACSSRTGGGAAASLADSITKAVYADDPAGVSSNFDSQLKTQVTRAEVGMLSDRMHALGAYKGLTLVSSDPSRNEYTYRAAFDHGAMNVVIRLDQNGQAAAYRVFPPG
jgi:hypothetical protein